MHHEMTKVRNRPCLVHRFDSLAEMTDEVRKDAKGREENRHIRMKGSQWVGRTFSGQWDGSNGLQTTVNSSWQDGLSIMGDMMDELRDAVTAKPVSRRRRRTWSDDSGDDLCFDRLRSGREDFWVRVERQTLPGPATATVLVNIGANQGRQSREILWRGAAALCLIELLEDAGYSVEFWIVQKSRRAFTNDTDSLVGVRAKSAQQPIDRSTLINAVSGWFFRTIGFGGEQLGCEEYGLTASCGLGSATTISSDEVEQLTTDDKAVVVDDVWNQSAAIDKVRDLLEQMNVTGDER
jgi:hypothetical protein